MEFNLTISAEVRRLFPGVAIGAFEMHGLRRPLIDPELTGRLEEARAVLLDMNIDIGSIAGASPFREWRSAYRTAGFQPSAVRSSLEALARRLLKEDEGIVHEDWLVSVYNALSVKYLVPMGAYDIELLPSRRIDLRLADPVRDSFAPLGAQAEKYPLKSNMVVYGCNDEVICYGFNHRDSARTACRPSTSSVLVVGEVVSFDMRQHLAAGLDSVRNAVRPHCATVSEIKLVEA